MYDFCPSTGFPGPFKWSKGTIQPPLGILSTLSSSPAVFAFRALARRWLVALRFVRISPRVFFLTNDESLT